MLTPKLEFNLSDSNIVSLNNQFRKKTFHIEYTPGLHNRHHIIIIILFEINNNRMERMSIQKKNETLWKMSALARIIK